MKQKVLSQDERDVIKSHLPEKYRLIAEILYWSAGRIGEVLSIRVRNLVPATGNGGFGTQDHQNQGVTGGLSPRTPDGTTGLQSNGTGSGTI